METKKFCGEVHRNLTLALLVKRIVIDETKRNLYHSKKKPWFTDELSSYGRLGRWLKSDTAIVTIETRRTAAILRQQFYGSNSCLNSCSNSCSQMNIKISRSTSHIVDLVL